MSKQFMGKKWVDVEFSILIPSEFTEEEAEELIHHFTTMILSHSDVESVASSDILIRPYT